MWNVECAQPQSVWKLRQREFAGNRRQSAMTGSGCISRYEGNALYSCTEVEQAGGFGLVLFKQAANGSSARSHSVYVKRTLIRAYREPNPFEAANNAQTDAFYD